MRMRLLALAALAPALAACGSLDLGFQPSLEGAAVPCPPVSILPEARRVIGQPVTGGTPAQGSYNHIAILRAAEAVCAEDAGRRQALVTVTYAVDGGPGTTGAARLELFAASTIKDVRLADKLIVTATPRVAQGSPQLLSQVIGPIDLPLRADGAEEILVGFQLTPAEDAFNRANPDF
jgi:hypothetical protein